MTATIDGIDFKDHCMYRSHPMQLHNLGKKRPKSYISYEENARIY